MAAVVSAQSPVCLQCSAKLQCVQSALETAEAHPIYPGRTKLIQHIVLVQQALLGPATRVVQGSQPPPVVASSRGVLRMDIGPEVLSYLAKLPPKVAGPVETLMRRGWFAYAKRELQAGRCPGNTAGWRKVLCEAIIRRDSRAAFESRLQAELGLKPNSAKVQASLGLAIFRAGRLLLDDDNSLTVSTD
jgi:hypothetical protein